MFEEMAATRFFVPKPLSGKYPWAVLEAMGDGKYTNHGKFPTEENAKLFLGLMRQQYVVQMKAKFSQAVEEEIAEGGR
jgi:hypothetical protein